MTMRESLVRLLECKLDASLLAPLRDVKVADSVMEEVSEHDEPISGEITTPVLGHKHSISNIHLVPSQSLRRTTRQIA